MANFRPFRGTTYDESRVEAADIFAPPYDVVGPRERSELAGRSPYNAIHVELPEDPNGGDRYLHAADIWRRWHEEGVVAIREEPALYVYRMSFSEEDGTARTSHGVIGALALDREGRGEVLPHEETTPKDKSDRLSLLRATRTNFSPIWGLSLAGGLGELCRKAIAEAGRPFAAHDEAGVLHERWTIEDVSTTGALVDLVASTPVLIADGHHRYDTACTYRGEADGVTGSDRILAYVVELSEDELAVQAIHRLVGGVTGDELLSVLADSFEISAGPSDPIELRDALVPAGALGLFIEGAGHLLTPSAPIGEGDELDSARLARALEPLPRATVTFQHGATESVRAVEEGRATAAVLLRPVSVERIAATAHGGMRMPPKSTFFYPKPRTGAVFRELEAG